MMIRRLWWLAGMVVLTGCLFKGKPKPPPPMETVETTRLRADVYQGSGVLLSGTTPGSPAEKAGLKAGDLLTQIGDVRIDGMQDFVHVLRTYNGGDVVLTRYMRDGVEEQVLVTLEARDLE